MGIIARQSIKASIVSLLGVGIGAVSRLFVYTKFLTPSEIGILETIIKLGIILVPFFFIGAPQVIIRFFQRFKNDKNDSGFVLTYFLLLIFILIPIASILYLLNKDFIFSYYSKAPELANYYLLPLIVAITFGGFFTVRSLSLIHKRIVVPTILNGLLDRVFILLLLLIYGCFQILTIEQFLNINILLFFVVPFILIILYVFKIIKPKLKVPNLNEVKNVLKKTSSYNLYLVLGSISGVIISAIDVNMISGNLGTELAGIYTIAFFMGTVIDIPKRSLTNIIYPILNQAIIDHDIKKVKSLYQKSSVNQLLAGTLIFSLVWFNIDAIFQIIPNGEEYATGKYVVLFIALSKLFDMAMGINTQIVELSKYYKFNLIKNVGLSILIIVLNLYFIKLESSIYGGINGVAFASFLAIVISNIGSFFMVCFKERIQPFTFNHLKIILIFIITQVLIYFIKIDNPFISIFFISLLVCLIFLILSIILNVSENFKLILQQFIKKFR